MRHQEARDQGFTTVTYIIIIWHLGKKGALRTAIDSQENILTLLQEKGTQSKWLRKAESIHVPRGKAPLKPICKSAQHECLLVINLYDWVFIPRSYAATALWWSAAWESRLSVNAILLAPSLSVLIQEKGEKIGSQWLTNCSWGAISLFSISDSGRLGWLPKDCILQKIQLHGVLKGWTGSEQRTWPVKTATVPMPAIMLSWMADSLSGARVLRHWRTPLRILGCQPPVNVMAGGSPWKVGFVMSGRSPFPDRGCWEHKETRHSKMVFKKILGILNFQESIARWWNVGSSQSCLFFFHKYIESKSSVFYPQSFGQEALVYNFEKRQ